MGLLRAFQAGPTGRRDARQELSCQNGHVVVGPLAGPPQDLLDQPRRQPARFFLVGGRQVPANPGDARLHVAEGTQDAVGNHDQEIARLKLASLGVEIDVLSDAQREYLTSWDR